ncbi:IQ domain-containing protein F1-like [Acomys russatus]|uniref:IQ domain-containing protein F1-like n=1 Tax=Acomys russatus TaxID=60746 RepID=UPI0021E22D7D|nr:IQ domain-containing protein F1-like [Acomys russatus]
MSPKTVKASGKKDTSSSRVFAHFACNVGQPERGDTNAKEAGRSRCRRHDPRDSEIMQQKQKKANELLCGFVSNPLALRLCAWGSPTMLEFLPVVLTGLSTYGIPFALSLQRKGKCCEIAVETIYVITEQTEPGTEKQPKKEKKVKHPPSPKVGCVRPSRLEVTPEPCPQKALKARKIQAWWRGTLVRRTLLKAAVSAWVIQCWWRRILAQKLEKRRLAALHWMALETRACVTIQSWVRMLQVRQNYCRLCYATRIIQMSWRWHKCHTRGFFQGSYEIIGDQLRLQLDIFLGSQVCRISDCISLPIKN